MNSLFAQKITLGISSCLLGDTVRFDAGHKKNSYITGVLNDYFEFRPFCPEVEIGLGIPREPIRLISLGASTRCVGTKNGELDVTQRLEDIAVKQSHWHDGLCGYIVKKDSPSCGMERVKIYSNGIASRNGVGIYARRLMENYPHLPIEEEGRLEDSQLRENFIQRVYIYSRWMAMQNSELDITGLQEFHARHKYIFMSHNQNQTRELGAILANPGKLDLPRLAGQYLGTMMHSLKTIATKNNHVNTLQHIQGYLKNDLSSADKAELNEIIDDYRNGLLPLIVPITLFRQHFRQHPNDYITQSYYLSPHPGELMLLNHI